MMEHDDEKDFVELVEAFEKPVGGLPKGTRPLETARYQDGDEDEFTRKKQECLRNTQSTDPVLNLRQIR